jgi:hypothetical protein
MFAPRPRPPPPELASPDCWWRRVTAPCRGWCHLGVTGHGSVPGTSINELVMVVLLHDRAVYQPCLADCWYGARRYQQFVCVYLQCISRVWRKTAPCRINRVSVGISSVSALYGAPWCPAVSAVYMCVSSLYQPCMAQHGTWPYQQCICVYHLCIRRVWRAMAPGRISTVRTRAASTAKAGCCGLAPPPPWPRPYGSVLRSAVYSSQWVIYI